MSMTGFQTFGFGQNDNNIGKKGKRFKLDKGASARIGFVWWPGLDQGNPNLAAPTPSFVGGPRHYMKGVGYFINKGPEYTKIAGEPPKTRIATIIVVWPTKSNGKLDTDAIQAAAKKAAGEAGFEDATDIEVMGWVFDDQKYDALRPIHGEWHLGGHDITVNCTDAQYQKMTFSPCKESVFKSLLDKQKDSALVKKIIADAQAIASNIKDDIGREMTIEQIREKLAGGSGGSSSSAVTGGSPVGGNEEIDGALENLLE